MVSHLLAPKFYQPVPSGTQVRRNHLTRLLAEGLASGRSLTLISAPAGYGKTSLAAEWCQQLEKPIAWLSLDDADDEPLRFFLYFVAALQKVDASIGQELMAMLTANQLPPRETLATWLINELEHSKAGVLCVLDDFHTIQDAFITAVLQEIITHSPRLFHLVILTREDPPFPLGRLRAHNRLTEIRAADLRFSRDEEKRFFQDVVRIRLSDGDLALLDERTEGWAAGLQLAGLSIQGQEQPSSVIGAMSGSHRFVLSYLTEEVLKRQPPEVHDFLLQTSILTRLNGELCDALTGRADSAARLEALLSANLFLIPLDDDGCWYRYHHLFAELLQARLRRAGPKRVAELHNRASAWYEAQAMPFEAVEHALAIPDGKRAIGLLEEFSWDLLNQGYARKMEAWLQAISPEERSHSPRSSLGFGWMHLLRSNFDQSQAYLQQAQAAIAQQDPGESTKAVQAECLALQANLAQTRGDLAGSLEAAQRSLALVPESSNRVKGLALLALGGVYRQSAGYPQAADALQQAAQASRQSQDWVTWMLAVTLLTQLSIQYGRLQFAAGIASHAVEELNRLHIAPPPVVGAVYGALGLVDFEANHVESARLNFGRGIRLATFSGHSGSLVYNKLHLARLLQTEGELAAAAQTLEEAAGLLRAGAPGWMRPELIYRQVSLLLAMGKAAEAEAILHQAGITPADEVSRRSEWIHLAWLRLLVARRDASAQALAGNILRFSEAGERNGTSLLALILGALAGGGGDWLGRALQLAESEGYVRIFTDEGEPLAALLRKLPATEYICKLLATFPAAVSTGEHPKGHPGLVEPLTDREREVLRLLAEGLSYGKIAERLVVSVNTVRFHVKGIYGKLGVEKQVQAVEKGRELGLIR